MALKNSCLDRFEISRADFDVGRSGIPGFARDKETGQRVFYKRADPHSVQFPEQVRNLDNEAQALRTLAGYHVPNLISVCDVYFTGGTSNKRTPYLFLEMMDPWNRLEQRLQNDEIELLERLEILIQLFETLQKAHSSGFTNGDIDLKHFYWSREHSNLTIIDWGNSEHGITDQADFAFDIAQSAEIVSILFPDPSIEFGNSHSALLPAHLKKASDLLTALYSWAPRHGRRPESDEGIFTASNLLIHLRHYFLSETASFRKSLNSWIPQWLNGQAENQWKLRYEEARNLAPHHPIVGLAEQCLNSNAKIEESLSLERQYRDYCLAGNWKACYELVENIIQKKYISPRPGRWLQSILAYLDKNPLRWPDGFSNVLEDVLWELLNQNSVLPTPDESRVNSLGGLGSAFIETIAWQLDPKLGNDIDQEWEQSSLSTALEKLGDVISEEIEIYKTFENPDLHRQDIQLLSDKLEKLKLYRSRTLKPEDDHLVDRLIDSYQVLIDTVDWAIEYFKESLDSKLGLSKLLFRIREIRSTLKITVNKAQHQRSEGSKWKLAQRFKTLWLQDKESWILFRYWYIFSKALTPHFFGYGQTSYWRYNSELYFLLRYYVFPKTNRTVREEIDLIPFDQNNYVLFDKSFHLYNLANKIIGKLPFGWQLNGGTLEFVCLLMAWADDLRFSEITPSFHEWITETSTKKISQRLDLSSLVLKYLKTPAQVKREPLGTKDSWKSPSQSTHVIPLENSATSSIVSTTEVINRYILADEQDSRILKAEPENLSLKNTEHSTDRKKIGNQSFFGRFAKAVLGLSVFFIALTVVWMLGLWASGIKSVNSDKPTSTLSNENNSPEPTQTPQPIIVDTSTPQLVSPSPAVITKPIITNINSKLLQFDSGNLKEDNRPASVVILPSLSNNETKDIPIYPSMDAGALFYDPVSAAWRIQSYSREVALRNPELGKMQLSFTSQMREDRIQNIQAISIIAEQTQFDLASGFGFYLKTEANTDQIVIKRIGEQYELSLFQDNDLVATRLLEENLGVPNTIFRLYVQLDGANLNVFFIAKDIETFIKMQQSEMLYVGSIPFSGKIIDAGLVSTGYINIKIEKLTVSS